MNIELINKEDLKNNYFKQFGTVASECYNTPIEKAEQVGKHCLKSGHLSGSRGIFFLFRISEISRCCSMQLNRHSVGVFLNQRSQRYCNENNFNYVIPPTIENNTKAKEKYIEHMNKTRELYKELNEIFEEEGLKGELARQDIRYVLPEATHTSGVYGFNTEALINFSHKRLCNRSQWEIRNMAKEMIRQALEVVPELKDKLFPNCVYLGKCPEQKSCK